MSKKNRKSKKKIEINSFSRVFWTCCPQNQNVKREMQPKNMGELQPTGRSKLLRSIYHGMYDVTTHADNLALGNTDPPEQQAYTTIFRHRKVVGPPMEAVARPTLTPRDQTLNYTPYSSGPSIAPIRANAKNRRYSGNRRYSV